MVYTELRKQKIKNLKPGDILHRDEQSLFLVLDTVIIHQRIEVIWMTRSLTVFKAIYSL